MRSRFVVPALAVWALTLWTPGAAAQSMEGVAALVGGATSYVVKSGDTLTSVGARFGVARATLIELNALRPPYALAVGQRLTVDNRHIAVANPNVAITINIAQRLLVITDGDQARAYPIAVGRKDWPTPVGPFVVTNKALDPAWDVPLSIQREMERQGRPAITRMEPSPLNPLGRHWIGLSMPGLGIHGTNAPATIYSFSSHGCIRMHPDDVANLFERVSIGTVGELVYQPVVMAVIDGRVWIEVHPDVYSRVADPSAIVRAAAERAGLSADINWWLVGDVIRQRRGRAVDVTGSTAR